MSKTIAEGKEDLERAFNLMNEELIKAEYKARVGYYGKYMEEIMEEVAPHTEAYKKLEEENKKLNGEIENHKQNIMQDELEIIPKLEEENKKLKEENKKLKEEVEKLKSTYVYDAKQVRDVC